MVSRGGLRGTAGREGCDCKRDQGSLATGQWVGQPETEGRLSRWLGNPRPLLPSAVHSVLPGPPGAIVLLPETLLGAECPKTIALIPTPTTAS